MIAEREACIIIGPMKKPNLIKLTTHRETIRTLASVELKRAAGGDEPFSGAALCPAPGIVPLPPRG